MGIFSFDMPIDKNTMSVEEVKNFANDVGKISTAVETMVKSDGWQIFLAHFEKIKEEIKDKSDYDTLQSFKADRTALDIVEEIFEEFKGYISDAKEAADLLTALSQEKEQPRGIFIGDEGKEAE